MRWFRIVRLRLRSLLQRDRLETQLRQELDFHIAEQTAEFIAQGMAEPAAALAARRLFGSAAVHAESCRDARRTRWAEDLFADLRYAARRLAASPAFTLAAVATLALGAGANLAFFSAAWAVLIRPLPYPEPDRLVQVETGIAGVGPVLSLRELSSAADYAGYLPDTEVTVQLAGEALRLPAAAATANLLRVLGVAPAQGRWFRPSEEHAGQHRVVVLSHRAWRERFAADPHILGRILSLDEEPFTIIGVMPAGYAFPSAATELWFPIRVNPANRGYMWGGQNLQALGRLRPGLALAAAQAELRPIADRIRPQFPWRMPDAWGTSSAAVPYRDVRVRDARPKLLALAAASLLLLLIACANVANLLVAQGIRRGREFTIREAIGAGRGRLFRQLAAENLLLAALGAAAALLAALLLLRLLPLVLPELPPGAGPGLDPYAASAVCLTLFGIFALLTFLPIRRGPTHRSLRLTTGLTALQLALATALLIGAGLMTRTLSQLANVDAGVQANSVLTASVTAGPSRCGTPARCGAFLREMSAALAAVPGAKSVNWANGIPLVPEIRAMTVDMEDHPRAPEAPAYALWHSIVTPGYFAALGIPLRAGRLFTEADHAGAEPVAIISESTARRFWPNRSALGKRIRPVSGRADRVVVGVVADVAQYTLTGFPSWVDGAQYLPLEQVMPGSAQAVDFSLLLEGNGLSAGMWQAALRRQFPDVAIAHVATIREVRDASVADRRSTAWLLALLSALGLLLGTVGVYGVLQQRAAQRSKEIGIRLALGAGPGRIAGAVLREALWVSLAGAAAGIAAALGLARILESLLYGVSTSDPVAFFVAPGLLVLTALLAALVPGLRAARLDPVQTLRAE